MVGVVVTYGHEDHTGAIGHLLEHVDAPVYATVKQRADQNVPSRRNLGKEAKLIDVHAGESVQIGPKVEFFHVCHCSRWCRAGIDTPGWSFTPVITNSTTPVDGILRLW